MFIKKFEIDNKRSARKRFVIKIIFYAFTKLEVEVFRKLQKTFVNFFFLIYYDFIKFLFVNLNVFKK